MPGSFRKVLGATHIHSPEDYLMQRASPTQDKTQSADAGRVAAASFGDSAFDHLPLRWLVLRPIESHGITVYRAMCVTHQVDRRGVPRGVRPMLRTSQKVPYVNFPK